jgi:hypothetical protein
MRSPERRSDEVAVRVVRACRVGISHRQFWHLADVLAGYPGAPLRIRRGDRVPYVKGTLSERFWPKVAKAESDACWLWMGSKNKKGYGELRNPGGSKIAHRVAWELRNGPVPAGLLVCHRCDTPACVNPAHLFIGTAKENTADAISKGRLSHGSQHYKTRLTESDVLSILNDSRRTFEVAAHYGVRPNTISRIRSRVRWRHVA